MRISNACLIIALFVLTFPIFAGAQSRPDPELQELERKKNIALAKQAIAEARKAEVEAKFPAPDNASLVGTTSIKDGKFVETEMLSYCAMQFAAQQLATRIRPATSPYPLAEDATLVVYNEADVRATVLYTVMLERLRNLVRAYQPSIVAVNALRAQSTGIVATPQRLFTVPPIGTFLNYLSLLKTDLEITPTELSIGEKELVAEVFRHLPAEFTLYYPARVPLGIQQCTANTLAECSPLLHEVMQAENAHLQSDSKDLRLELDEAIRQFENQLESLTAELEELEALNRKTSAVRATIIRIKGKIGVLSAQTIQARTIKSDLLRIAAELSKLDLLYETTMEELGLKAGPKKGEPSTQNECPDKTCTQTTSVNVNLAEKKDEGGGDSKGGKSFVSYVLAERLFRVMQGPNSYWIDLQVVKAGGSVRSKTNIITNFFANSRVTFNGGAIVYFNVFANNGISKVSGVVQIHEGYRTASSIKRTCN